MIFDVPTLVSTISEFMALAPGDLILTGTPSGVGFRREPQLLLNDGDLVVCEINGVGRLENRVVSESA
jgi:acylpyruvate hydrolase